tara:strand:+ start:659 stop:832 length:174 start_codon:yes stop_codon:yes gene_type:complete
MTSWTTVALLTKTPLRSDIEHLLNQMYLNQNAFLQNVRDLSILLVNDANARLPSLNN